MGKLTTTEEMLAALSVTIRLAAYDAISAANHLALNSQEQALAMERIAGVLGECADAVRGLREAYFPPSTSE